MAISDPTGVIATSLDPIRRRGLQADIAAIAAVVDREGVGKILLGLPLSLSGEIGSQARLVLRFKATLERALGLPVETWDERYSTHRAEELLRSRGITGRDAKARVDSAAAALLLQEYLNTQAARRRSGEDPA